MANQYLSLTEYSSKHKVSISTLRRRIKAEDIKYRFEDGKYLILDEPVSTHQKVHRPSLKSEKTIESARPNFTPARPEVAAEVGIPWNEELQGLEARDRQEPVLTAANRLLTELKRAYTQILQEKEEQILHFREEVSDLKTLVRVLESDNERLRRMTSSEPSARN